MVRVGFAGSMGPADRRQRMGESWRGPECQFTASLARGPCSTSRSCTEAGAALESKGCQCDVIHLLCPLVGLAVARGCPAAGLLEQFYQTFKGFFVGDDAVHLCGNVCWPICPHRLALPLAASQREPAIGGGSQSREETPA